MNQPPLTFNYGRDILLIILGILNNRLDREIVCG